MQSHEHLHIATATAPEPPATHEQAVLFAAPASGSEFVALSTVSPIVPTKRQRQRDAGGEFRRPEHVDRRDIGSDSPTMSPPATNRRPDGRVTERGSEAPPAPAECSDLSRRCLSSNLEARLLRIRPYGASGGDGRFCPQDAGRHFVLGGVRATRLGVPRSYYEGAYTLTGGVVSRRSAATAWPHDGRHRTGS